MRRSAKQAIRGAAVTVVAALVLIGCSPARGAGPAAGPEDFAGVVDVDGRSLHLECRGQGSPTVLLQSGYGRGADGWSAGARRSPSVLEGVAAFTRVCAYDRPGSFLVSTPDGRPGPPVPGRSGSAPPPRTASDVVDELRGLLGAAGVPGPFVLVAHSLAGPFAQLHARTHPGEVAGLVLVDPTPPALRDLLPPDQWTDFARFVAGRPSPVPGYTVESYDLDTSLDQLLDSPAPRPLPAVTLVAAGTVSTPPPGDPSAADVTTMDGVRPEAFARLAADLPDSRLVTIPDATHYIQTDRPDAVVDAIRSVADPR